MNKTNLYEVLQKYSTEIKSTIYTAFVFLNIDMDIVKILIWLMLIDMVFGIIKSFKMGRKFSFKTMFFGLITKLLVLLIPMTLALVGKGLKTYDFTPLVDIVLRIVVVAEGFSIFTSMYVIKTGKESEQIDIITLLLNVIRKSMLGFINLWLKKIETPNS